MSRNNRTKKRTPLIVTLILISISLLCGCLFFVYKEYKSSNIAGEYTGYVDLSEDFALRAYTFLADIEDVNVSYLDVLDAYKDCGIQSSISFGKELLSNMGTYSISVDEETYKGVIDEGYVTLANLMEGYISVRLATEGYDYPDNEREELIKNALGSELTDYLKNTFTDIFVPYETIAENYNDSGSFVLNDDRLILGSEECSYIYDDDRLVVIKNDDEQTTNVYKKNMGGSN